MNWLQLGAVVGSSIFKPVVDSFPGSQGSQVAFFGCAAVALLGVVLTFCFVEDHRGKDMKDMTGVRTDMTEERGNRGDEDESDGDDEDYGGGGRDGCVDWGRYDESPVMSAVVVEMVVRDGGSDGEDGEGGEAGGRGGRGGYSI